MKEVVYQNIMKMVSDPAHLIQWQDLTRFQTRELTSPSQVPRLGNNFLNFSRVPAAKSIVNDPLREKEIGWGDVNKRMPGISFEFL